MIQICPTGKWLPQTALDMKLAGKEDVFADRVWGGGNERRGMTREGKEVGREEERRGDRREGEERQTQREHKL